MDMVVEKEEATAAAGMDFMERLGPDTSAVVFAALRDPADLARAATVSRSWRTLVMAVHLGKIQCLRMFPEVSVFTRGEQSTASASSSNNGVNEEDAGSTAAASAWENHKREQRVYMRLAHALLSNRTQTSCIASCIGASSTDTFPVESIQNTLEPGELEDFIPSYWSSGGQEDPEVPEFLVYQLCSDLCLIDEIRIQPFKAFFQHGHPIYSAQYVRVKFGCPKSPLRPEDLVSEENEGQVTADDNYMWMYTPSEFPMLQENVLQSFKLPCPVLCIGGVVKVEFLGRIQKQEIDDLYYICIAHVQVLGTPLPRELGAAPCKNGIVLKYFPDHESSGGSGSSRPKWHDIEGRIWRELKATGQGIGFDQALLSRLLGPSLQFAVEENGHGESKEVTRPLP
ncbi:F-box protein [Dichanthelium oligosanthes]|uniref:F-box protein n=1 Tax=Dichanthelium oligosanthes TaxID=888268 RepID=A0A1E5UYY1_9POAL|nr:F-box protein [Dichanthelium oligosanthes]